MPSSIVTYHNTILTIYNDLVMSAEADLAAAQTALALAEKDAVAAIDAIAGKLDERKAVQAQLAVVTQPAQAAPLLTQLEGILLALHHQQASLLAATTAGVAHSGKIARAEAQLRRASAGVAVETAAKAKAILRTEAEQAWIDVVSSTEFTTAVAQATSAFNAVPRTTPSYAAAKARIEAAIPPGLLTLAREGAADALDNAAAKRALVTTALADIDTALEADGGFAAQVEKLTALFEARRAVLRDRATQRLARIDRALRLLAGVATTSALTDSEEAAIGALTAAVDAKQIEIVDAVALPEPPSVIADLEAELKVLHDRWEAAVPGALWRSLDAFDEAVRILMEVTTADVTPVITAFEAAGTDLAAELTAQHQNALERASLAESLLELTPVAERAAAPELVFSALRGDD